MRACGCVFVLAANSGPARTLQGLVTLPVLYAAEQFPQLAPMIERRFNQPGDVQLVSCHPPASRRCQAHARSRLPFAGAGLC